MQLSSSDQELIRTQGQETRLYLSIFQPKILMQCQVNNPSATKGDRIIIYDNVTVGSFGLVESGQTLLIGTTPGGRDIGKIRIRSATASQFVISENSNIPWQDNLYLTVQKFWDVWPVFPRIIKNPANDLDVIFFKDYDISYNNQNSIFGTFINAGPHRAKFLDGGQAQIYYSSTGTYNILGSTLNYNWQFEGGTPSSSTSPDPGLVTYTAPGQYVTKLSISGSNGENDVTYRYVSIYDRPSAGTGTCIERWDMKSLDGSRSEGGLKTTITIYDNIQIDDNAVVVLFSEDYYGSTKKSLGGNYPNASDIVFVGMVEKDTIQYDYQHSSISFEVASITTIMKDSIGFSVSCQDDTAPDTWYKILGLNIRRALYHYLKWHTTILSIADFQFVGTDYPIQYFDSDRTSMFDALDNFMKGTLIGGVNADRQGKIWAEVNAEAYTNPTGSFPSTFDISKRDWMGQPVVHERVQDDYSYLEYGGIAYQGIASGTFQALMACAPGNAPTFRGKTETLEGLALSNQGQLNQLVGNVLANRNSKYQSIEVDITENLRNLDIAPQEAVSIHVDAKDTVKGQDINILGIPSDFTWNYDPKTGHLYPRITFSNLVSGNIGDTITIPAPDTVGDGFNVPGFTIPPILPFILSGTIIPTGTISVTNPYMAVNVSSSQLLTAGNQAYAGWTLASFITNSSGTYSVVSDQVIINSAGIYLVGFFAKDDNITITKAGLGTTVLGVETDLDGSGFSLPLGGGDKTQDFFFFQPSAGATSDGVGSFYSMYNGIISVSSSAILKLLVKNGFTPASNPSLPALHFYAGVWIYKIT